VASKNGGGDGVVVVASIVVMVVMLLLAASGYSIYRVIQLADTVETNERHLCWLMANIYGIPEHGAGVACEMFREQLGTVYE
jgi:hypothetical protein